MSDEQQDSAEPTEEEKQAVKEAIEVTEEAKPETEKKESPGEIPLFEKAKAEADRLEAANKRTEELIKKQEAIIADMEIRGRGLAGQPEQTEEQKAMEAANKLVEGYGVDLTAPIPDPKDDPKPRL